MARAGFISPLVQSARVYIFYKFTSLVLFKLFNIWATFEYNLIDVIVNHEKIFSNDISKKNLWIRIRKSANVDYTVCVTYLSFPVERELCENNIVLSYLS